MLVWCDLETTGLDPNKEAVLEIACIVTDDALNEVARFERVIYCPHADAIVAHCRIRERDWDEWIASGPSDAAQRVANYRKDTREDTSPWRVPGIDVDPYVVKMHWENGLWEQVRYGQALATVDADLREFIQEHAVKTTTAADRERASRIDEIFGKELDILGEKYGVERADKPNRELTGIIPSINDDGSLTYEPDSRYRERIREAIRRTKTIVDKPQLAGSTISFDRAFLKAHFPLTTDEESGVLHYRSLDTSSLNELARRVWPTVYEARPRVEKVAHRGMRDIEASIATAKHYIASLAASDNIPRAA